MKQKITNLFKIIIGTESNIPFYINISSLITGMLLLFFALIATQNNTNSSRLFTYASAIFLSLWLTISQDSNSVQKFTCEFFRLIVFFIVFLFSLYGCANFVFTYNTKSVITFVLSCIGLFFCVCYSATKIVSMFLAIKKIFSKIKAKLFNSTEPATSKFIALIENITAVLVSVGGFAATIKSITESVIKTLDYFK